MLGTEDEMNKTSHRDGFFSIALDWVIWGTYARRTCRSGSGPTLKGYSD